MITCVDGLEWVLGVYGYGTLNISELVMVFYIELPFLGSLFLVVHSSAQLSGRNRLLPKRLLAGWH